MFVRLDLARERGEVVASIASAGHPPALIARADGRIVQSPARGILLGVMDFPIEALHVAEHRLAAGDTLILYTDGLTEARRHRVLFDVDGVKATLSALHGAPPPDIANGLVAAALQHADAPVSDDIAIVVVRVADRLKPLPG